MSQENKCDGCGLREKTDIPVKQRTIKPVRFTIVVDERELHGTPPVQAQSDLCVTCVGTLLHTYFGIAAEGTLEVPGFVEPTSLERARAAER